MKQEELTFISFAVDSIAHDMCTKLESCRITVYRVGKNIRIDIKGE